MFFPSIIVLTFILNHRQLNLSFHEYTDQLNQTSNLPGIKETRVKIVFTKCSIGDSINKTFFQQQRSVEKCQSEQTFFLL